MLFRKAMGCQTQYMLLAVVEYMWSVDLPGCIPPATLVTYPSASANSPTKPCGLQTCNHQPESTFFCRDAVKAQVVQCCHQFLEMQEEEIQPYLSTFMTTIWGLLVACSSKSGQDNLALAAISFLTTVCRSTHHKLFASGDTIKQVCTCLHCKMMVLHINHSNHDFSGRGGSLII